MISVQNLLQRLNGNSHRILLFSLIIFLGSCSSSKRSTLNENNTLDNEVGKDKDDEDLTYAVDTIQWTLLPEDEYEPITGDEIFGPGIVKKDRYSLSLFIPFDADSELRSTDGESSQPVNNRFLNFYAGSLLAFKQLESEGMDLNVKVFDTERDLEIFKNQLNSFENRTSDLIIGPYDRECLRTGAEWAKDNEVPMISPWQASTRITQNNPYYIQLRPNLNLHYEKMIKHALDEFEPEQIVLLGRANTSDESRIANIQNMVASLYDPLDSVALREYFIKEDSLLQGDSLFQDFVDEAMPTSFIIPNWRADEEDFIYSCMRKLNVDKGLSQVYVYGMPIMLDSEKISFDLYRNLNVRVCRSKFVDATLGDVIKFERRYFDEYGALPTRDAFEGFDVILLAARALHKYGLSFQYYLDQEVSSFLQTRYRIERNFESDGIIIDRFADINYFENQHLDIIEYKNERFQRSDR